MQEKKSYLKERFSACHKPGVVILVLLFLIISFDVFPQKTLTAGKTNIFSFDYFSLEDGLPNNQIQCIFQDKNGWI